MPSRNGENDNFASDDVLIRDHLLFSDWNERFVSVADSTGADVTSQHHHFNDNYSTHMTDEDAQKFRNQMKLKICHFLGPDNIERSVEVIPHPIRDFQHAGFHSVIQKSIDIAGFKSPTAIQAQAWPVIYRGLDLIGIAPTGSGKTLAYTLPALSKCLNSSVSPPTTVCEPSALIIVPTRELATQVFEDAQFFADAFANLLTAHMHDHSQEIIIPSEVSENKVRIALVAGGSNYKMMMGADIAVATIGRLFDVICKGVFHVRRVCYFVLDEADKLLSSEGDFIEYIRLLCSKMPRNRQSLLFSATFMDDVERLSDVVFKKDSIMIKSTEKPCVAQNIRQVPLIVNDSLKKQKMLLGFCNTVQGCKILVLVNTKKGVDMLYELLNAFGIPCVFSHGDVDSNARNAVLSIFKKDHRLAIADFNKIRDNQSLRTFEATLPLVMIATDVYGRGIDIKDLPYVINYDSPKTYDDYIQRCGRVGRSSNKGTAITFLDRNASEECLSCIWERGSANIDEGILERLKNKDEYLLPESINSIYVPSTDRETRSRNPIWNENNNGNSNDRNDYNQGWTDSKNNINNNQGRWDDNNNSHNNNNSNNNNQGRWDDSNNNNNHGGWDNINGGSWDTNNNNSNNFDARGNNNTANNNVLNTNEGTGWDGVPYATGWGV